MLFCVKYRIPALPLSGDQLVHFSCWLVASGRIKKHGSLLQYLSAASTHHKKLGLWCPTPSQYGPLLYTVKGIRRDLACPTKSSNPITIPILTNLLTTSHSNLFGLSRTLLIAMKSLTSVLFFSMLRSSSLIPPYPGALDPVRQLTWGRVQRCTAGAVLTVTLDKTIQFKERIHQVTLAARPESIFCPVNALDTMAKMKGYKNCKDDELVFQVPDGYGGWRPLVKYNYKAWLDHRFDEMGVNKNTHSIHGLRHGALNFAILCEPNIHLIKVSSNHLSDAIFCYSKIPAISRFQVSEKMMGNLPSVL